MLYKVLHRLPFFKYNFPVLTYKKLYSTNTQFNKKNEYVAVYKFPYIRILGIINRMKLYHTGLTGLSIPGSVMLNQINLISSGDALFATALGLTGCMVLYSLGYLCNKFIGFIYVHKEEPNIKVAYIDFWGNRKEEIVPFEDIVPLSDLPVSYTDLLFVPFKRYSTKNVLKLNVKVGQILHKENFNKVFIS